MRLRKITLYNSGRQGSPTLYATDRKDIETIVVQGWRVEDPTAVADAAVPTHETLVEVPAEWLRKALES